MGQPYLSAQILQNSISLQHICKGGEDFSCVVLKAATFEDALDLRETKVFQKECYVAQVGLFFLFCFLIARKIQATEKLFLCIILRPNFEDPRWNLILDNNNNKKGKQLHDTLESDDQPYFSVREPAFSYLKPTAWIFNQQPGLK